MLSKGSVQTILKLIFIFNSVTLLTSGCWNWREMNQLAIVSGTAVDLSDAPGKVTVTVQIIKPGSVKGGGGGGGGGGASGGGGGGGAEKPVWIVKSSGNTISEAVRNFVFESNRELYFPHNQILIISKDAAKKGVRPYIDYFIRSHEPRPTLWVLIADGKAGDVLNVPGHLEKISAMEIGRLVNIQNRASETVAVNLEDFTARLISKTVAPIASRIQIVGETGNPTVRIIGAAVFKHDKLVGELDKTETRGLLWIQNKVQEGVTIVSAPHNDGKVTLEIRKVNVKMKAALRKNEPQISLTINVMDSVGNQTGSLDLSKPKILKELAKRQAAVIRKEIWASLRKAHQLNTDVFGFGEAVHRSYPKQWKAMGPEWNLLFPTLKVNVDIKTTIQELGLIMKPVIPEKED